MVRDPIKRFNSVIIIQTLASSSNSGASSVCVREIVGSTGKADL